MEQPTDPLHEWNRLNIENAERGICRAFYVGTLSGSSYIDKLSTWLLAGTGATAALFVTQVGSILPLLSELGFKRCGAFLVVSGLFGLLAKLRAVAIAITLEQERVMTEAMQPHIDKHSDDEDKIQEMAEQRGVQLVTEIDIQRVANAFLPAFPKVLHRSLHAKMRQGMAVPHAQLRSAVRSLLYQAVYSALQTFFFAVFVIVAVAYAAAI